MIKVLRSVLVILALGFTPVYAATLNVDVGGQLHGATGVVVGTLGTFDVEFVDGTCADLFNGCDQLSDFAFQTSADAAEGAQALLDMVFVDDDLLSYYFDSNPLLTNGCSSVGVCFVVTPYGLISSAPPVPRLSIFFNEDSGPDGGTFGSFDPREVDLSFEASGVYARWSTSPPLNPVPIPAALPLFGTGLAAIAWFRRRKVQVELAT